jgi:hypothetical protein
MKMNRGSLEIGTWSRRIEASLALDREGVHACKKVKYACMH